MTISRRSFLGTTIAGSLALGVSSEAKDLGFPADPQNATPASGSGKRPIIICSGNGYDYLDRGFEHLSKGGDTLESAIKVVTGPEDDPKDDSVGLEDYPTKRAWSNSTPAACMVPPVVPDLSAASATSRMFRKLQRRSWSIPATSCWWGRAPNGSRLPWGFRARIC